MPVYSASKLSETVHCIKEADQWGVNPHIYLIKGVSRTVVVDTGTGSGDLLRFVRRLDGFRRDQLLVINTSNLAHHTGANHQFSALGKAGKAHNVEDLCASNRDPKFTASKANNYQWEVGDYRVTRWLPDQERIQLDESDPASSLLVVQCPGVTPDSLALWYAREARLFLGSNFHQLEPVQLSGYSASLKEYVASFNGLFELVARQPQPALVVYHSARFDQDQPCMPVFKIFQRFLCAIVAGIQKPSTE